MEPFVLFFLTFDSRILEKVMSASSFGLRLTALRKEAKLNKSQLAEIIEVSHAQIVRYEQNKSFPTTARLKVIADYFGVSTDYLLDGGEEENKTGKLEEVLEMKSFKKFDKLPLKYKKKVIEYIDLVYLKFSQTK